MDANATEEAKLKDATKDMLEVLWLRAANNEASPAEINAIQRACIALAIAEHGVDRIMPYPEWCK